MTEPTSAQDLFKGRHFDQEIIILCVRWYLAFKLSSRDLVMAERGIPLVELNSVAELPVYIDGADEATADGVLIKGGGAALTREKVVAAASANFVCIIDDTKLVEVLGKFPLPVEVIPMARSYVARQLVKMGGQPVWREGVVTDNGNVILDVHNLRLNDPVAFESALNQVAGVVTVGLFALRRADVLIVAGDDYVKTLVCGAASQTGA